MGVGVEEEKEDHAVGHEVHVDTEDDAGVVEAPALADAADGIRGAGEDEEGGEDEPESGAVVGEIGEEDGGYEGKEDEEIGADQRFLARVEDGRESHAPTARLRPVRGGAQSGRGIGFDVRAVLATGLWVGLERVGVRVGDL